MEDPEREAEPEIDWEDYGEEPELEPEPPGEPAVRKRRRGRSDAEGRGKQRRSERGRRAAVMAPQQDRRGGGGSSAAAARSGGEHVNTFDVAEEEFGGGGRARQDPRLFDPRSAAAPRRRSGSPVMMLISVLAFLGIVGGVVWHYYENRPRDPLALETGPVAAPAVVDPAEAEAEKNRTLIQTARDLEEQEMFSAAIERYSMITEGAERDQLLAEAYARQGERYADSGRYNLARDAFARARDHQPGEAEHAYRLGQAHWTLGRQVQQSDPAGADAEFDQAERYLSEALEMDEAHLPALESLARVAIARGDPLTAARHLRRIHELAPESKEAERARQIMTQRGWSF